ncbi:hypothetical protein R1flu_004010 [Riccia fluitans]|uniref:Uncharacterized protein n=1 Tax=Riccia fluitans TaxID=41844 RepID=A0ABD1YP30_9MARC
MIKSRCCKVRADEVDDRTFSNAIKRDCFESSLSTICCYLARTVVPGGGLSLPCSSIHRPHLFVEQIQISLSSGSAKSKIS